MCDKPIPVAARSQVWVCGRSLALGLRVRIPPWARMSIPLDVVCCDGLISRPEEFYRVCVGEELENCSIPAQGKLSHLPAYCPQTPVPVPSLILDPSVNQTNPLTAGAATLPLVQSSLVSIVTLYFCSKLNAGLITSNTQPPTQRVQSLPGKNSGQGMKLTTHLHVRPKLRISESIFPHPNTP